MEKIYRWTQNSLVSAHCLRLFFLLHEPESLIFHSRKRHQNSKTISVDIPQTPARLWKAPRSWATNSIDNTILGGERKRETERERKSKTEGKKWLGKKTIVEKSGREATWWMPRGRWRGRETIIEIRASKLKRVPRPPLRRLFYSIFPNVHLVGQTLSFYA